MYCSKRHAGGAGFQQPGGLASLYAPVKVRVRLLLFGLSCGCLRHFFSASMPRKSSPKRLHLDSPLIHSDEPPVGRKRLFPCARASRLPQTTGWSRPFLSPDSRFLLASWTQTVIRRKDDASILGNRFQPRFGMAASGKQRRAAVSRRPRLRPAASACCLLLGGHAVTGSFGYPRRTR
jgi:hypothetical protein